LFPAWVSVVLPHLGWYPLIACSPALRNTLCWFALRSIVFASVEVCCLRTLPVRRPSGFSPPHPPAAAPPRLHLQFRVVSRCPSFASDLHKLSPNPPCFCLSRCCLYLPHSTPSWEMHPRVISRINRSRSNLVHGRWLAARVVCLRLVAIQRLCPITHQISLTLRFPTLNSPLKHACFRFVAITFRRPPDPTSPLNLAFSCEARSLRLPFLVSLSY